MSDFVMPEEEALFSIFSHLGIGLGFTVEELSLGSLSEMQEGSTDPLHPLIVAAGHAGMSLNEITPNTGKELVSFVRDGYPVLVAPVDGNWAVLQSPVGRSVEAVYIGPPSQTKVVSAGVITAMMNGNGSGTPARVFVAKKQLECDLISSAPSFSSGASGSSGAGHGNGGHGDDDGHGHHEHLSPVRRFFGLLKFETRDIWIVVLFALVAGILGLASPLAIESLVNVVSWGTYFQPLLVLALLLLTCLGLSGVLKVLQTVVVEIIQRRQFVRIVSDLAQRFPRANQASLKGEFPRELANRVFDIMTIQKATAVLLMDGITIILTTIIGLILLAFYHPFLLGFDIVLVIAMISITWLLGRGGIRTAISESLTKYAVAHWLQDVISAPGAFKTNGGESLAVRRANQLTASYVTARQEQFRVVLRQVIFATGLQIIASTAVLGLGGYLVINGQLTLGQLVASELVVTVVVGAFAKAGKSLEKYYDLMAGVDKVGHLLDVATDATVQVGDLPDGPAEVSWSDLVFKEATGQSHVPTGRIAAGARVAVTGDNASGRSRLARCLAGLQHPNSGHAEIAGYDAAQAAMAANGQVVGLASGNEIFHGTVRDNVDLGRLKIGQNRVREALQAVGLWSSIRMLPNGVQSRLQTGGSPLTRTECVQLILAQAIAGNPRLLIIDGLLDELDTPTLEQAWSGLTSPEATWTLLVGTNRTDIAERCEQQIYLRRNA